MDNKNEELVQANDKSLLSYSDTQISQFVQQANLKKEVATVKRKAPSDEEIIVNDQGTLAQLFLPKAYQTHKKKQRGRNDLEGLKQKREEAKTEENFTMKELNANPVAFLRSRLQQNSGTTSEMKEESSSEKQEENMVGVGCYNAYARDDDESEGDMFGDETPK